MSCGKRTFETRALADLTKSKLRQAGKGDGLRAYHCAACAGFHLGRRRDARAGRIKVAPHYTKNPRSLFRRYRELTGEAQ